MPRNIGKINKDVPHIVSVDLLYLHGTIFQIKVDKPRYVLQNSTLFQQFKHLKFDSIVSYISSVDFCWFGIPTMFDDRLL